jgi:hypothetical protein
MFRKANNVFSVILDDNAQAAAALPAVGALVTDANLAKGAVVLTDLGNLRLDAAAFGALVDGDQYRIVQGKGLGQQLMKTPVITVGKDKFTINAFKPAVQQVTIIGYNGTTGALPVSNNTDYWIKIRKRDNDAANRSQPMSLFAGPVRTDATGTQAELATLLVANGYLNFKDEPANHYLKFEAICDEPGAAITGTVANFGVTLNSKGVTLDGTVTNVVVGDFIRLGGTGVSDPVYKVTAVNSPTSLTLATPYTGDTATIAVASVEVITAALAATADFGIKITGLVAPFNVNTFRDYYANRFTATFSDSSVLVTPFVGARNGNGVWQQVAMDEYLSYGYEGQNQQLATPSIARDQDVKIPNVTTGATALTSKYSCLNIAWTEDIRGLVSVDNGLGNAVIYLNLLDVAGTGSLSAGVSSGKELVTALGLSPAAFNE